MSLELDQTLEVVTYHSKLCNPHIFLAIDEPLKTDNVQEIHNVLICRALEILFLSAHIFELTSLLPITIPSNLGQEEVCCMYIPLKPFEIESTKSLFQIVPQNLASTT